MGFKIMKRLPWPSRAVAVDLITVSHGFLFSLPALGMLGVIPRTLAGALLPVAMACILVAWLLWMRTLRQ